MLSVSASGEEVIHRDLNIEDIVRPSDTNYDFDDFYEIEQTSGEVLSKGYKRIALQFPDALLPDSVPIYSKLKERIEKDQTLYILADTSYGSCCVDEVASQHVAADALIHYGHACMSQTYRLPVIYVFGKKPLDIDACVSKLLEFAKEEVSTIRLKFEVAYAHVSDHLAIELANALKRLNLELLYNPIPTRLYPTESSPSSKVKDVTIFYVGGESLGLTNLLMTHPVTQIFSYDPSTSSARLESSRTNKLLMRRYAQLQKAKDSDVFGILVGTLGIASYLPLIKHLRTLLTRAHKKSYTISVGKLNPAKLANFSEIECFIVVACPENSIIDAKDFFAPIITPFELDLALRPAEAWTGAEYFLDFDQVISSSNHDLTDDADELANDDDGDDNGPTFSLVTGTYRHAKHFGGRKKTPETSSDLILRDQENALKVSDSAAAQHLRKRTYQGLDPKFGEDAPSVLEQGRAGIARSYHEAV